MKDFLLGISYFLSGIKLIIQPGLRKFIIIPFLINIVFFTLLFLMLFHYTTEWNLWFADHLPTWLAWLGILFWLVMVTGFSLFMIFTFVMVANIFGAPFNSLLAEQVAWQVNRTVPPVRSYWQMIKDTPRMIGRQLSLIFYYLPRAALILVLFFIPVIQLIASVLWLLFNAWFLAITYLDYPTDNQQISLRMLRAWLKTRPLLVLGLGCSILLSMMIPVVNFIAMPVAVVAATRCWLLES